MRASIPLVRPADPGSTTTCPAALEAVRRLLNKDWFRCVLLAAIAILIHFPALQGQLIWDDAYLAHDNPFIKSPVLIPESFRHYLFLDSLSAHYRPVQNISYIIDYFFWNTDEFGFHLTNVLLHTGSAVLLYFVLCRLIASFFRSGPKSNSKWVSSSAFLIALLWAVHPVHSAAVDYISGRADSLAFLFAAAGWLLFWKAQDLTRTGWRVLVYIFAASCALLALLSREIACIWIILFIAHQLFLATSTSFQRRICAALCCVMLLGIYAGLRQLPTERATPPPQAGWTAPVRAVLMARALGDYARLMIFPTNLHMERTVVDPSGWRSNSDWRRGVGTEYLSILGLLLLALFAYGSLKNGRGQELRIFGASWFVAAYLPVSNMFQLNATVAEHWLYLPLVGFLIFLCGLAVDFSIRYRRAVAVIAVVAAVSLSARSFVRSTDWANEEIFYQRTLAAGGDSPRVAVNLAQVYVRRGDYSAGEKILRRVVQTNPDYPTARINLGNVLLHQGKSDEAEKFFRSLFEADKQISKEYPRTWIAAVNLACVRHKAGDDKSAFTILDEARNAHPGVWQLVSYESQLCRETGRMHEAFQLVEDFARENWWHYGAAVAMGRLYAEANNVAKAEAALVHASWLDVHDAEALHLLAMIKFRGNDLDAAFRAQRSAIRRQPDQPSQYILLSNILERMGRSDDARAALARVSRLRALAEAPPVGPL
jgi:tetratricopeptide (TPR) repeat protein